MLFADEIPRVSLAQLKAAYKPRRFRELNTIEILVAGHVTELHLIATIGDGCVTGTRKWLRCDHCLLRCNVTGWVFGLGWCCKRCLGWRSRARPAVNNPTPNGIL